jgi:ATP-dependent DNA ligase
MDFTLIHSKQYDREVSLVAFDLVEMDGKDYRPAPLVDRKLRFAKLLAKANKGIEYNDHIEGSGSDIFAAAGRPGHEGIVASLSIRWSSKAVISSEVAVVPKLPTQRTEPVRTPRPRG